MTELVKNGLETKGSSRSKFIDFIKLVLIVYSITFFWIFFITIGLPEQSIQRLAHQMYTILSSIFRQKSQIDITFVRAVILASLASVLTLISLLIFHKFIKRKSLHEIGIKSPRGENFNIIYSIIGILIILYVYNGNSIISVFFGDFNISLFIESIPLTFLGVFAEEVIYRGMILTDAMDKFGELKGISIASIVFTIPHFAYPELSLVEIRYLLHVFLLGLLFGYLYSKKRNLTSPIIGHILANALSTLL